MQSSYTEDAIKVLDYWFVMEFLGQDSYEMCTNAADIKRKLKAYKKKLAKNKTDNQKQITAFLDLDKEQSFSDAIKKECESCNMKTWGNITVYMGKIKREFCIEHIAKCLNSDMKNMPEKSYDDIVIASFQIDSNWQYVPYSFSLSSIIWAVNQLSNTNNEQLSDILSMESYKEAVDEIEKSILNIIDEDEIKKLLMSKTLSDIYDIFDDEEISMNKLKKIYSKIREKYMSFLEGEEVYGVSVQFFKNQEAKEQYEEDNYCGLSHPYFSDDLKMVKEQLEYGNIDTDEGMGKYLINYINAPKSEEIAKKQRYDLLNADNEKLELWLLEVLNLKNAPIGKWPSRYMPALMQQVAINFAVEKERLGLFGKNGNAFSVNGPPGTGKTTLLKEVIANNIVEKARKLAEYDDPDTAFEEHRFLFGEKQKGGYSKYISSWYSFKDESINDYSLLVTSCNNAAVENITKELPLESGILNSLKSTPKDGESMKSQLSEIENLFSVENSPKTERLFCGRINEGDYKEIYFTEYAKNLMGKNDVWGLVAAPLGKKSNIVPFYNQVLKPLHWDFYPNRHFKEVRKEKYEAAQKKFKEQLKKVTDIQIQLSELGSSALEAKQAEKLISETNAYYKQQMYIARQELEHIYEEKKKLNDYTYILAEKLQEEMKKQAEIRSEYDLWDNTYIQLEEKAITIKKQVGEVMSPLERLIKMLFKNQYSDSDNMREVYRRQLTEIKKSLCQAEEKLKILKIMLQNVDGQIKILETELNVNDLQLENIINQEERAFEVIETCKKNIKTDTEGEVSKIKEYWKRESEKFRRKDDTHRGIVIDDEFISSILSKDMEISTKAQTANPWITDYYNREREKLLYYALQLTKEFVLNSRCCRDNFTLLGQYWGLEMNEENKRISFHKEDRERMAGALYQTLFILVPVVSSTFAAIGTLLRDVKAPGIVGTLVVDEAGQAQPQMAVGALFRSRRAMIVGDPRQVEPVVTGDLDLLKKSYNGDIYGYYRDSSLSVQRCADIWNPFGTYIENGTDDSEWVGCPILVHRRCISPMYEISNKISYGGIMKQQTLPPSEEKIKTFVYDKSQWINVDGIENGKKDHFVKQQGEETCKILELAFQKNEFPNLYIISPFKSVIYGMQKYINEYCIKNSNSSLNKSRGKDEWIRKNIGTVHTFQGKEANEVIFLLGCDTKKDAEGAVRWVNSNIVNVAVTRAKYRLYVIGDIKAWEPNTFVCKMKDIMDTLV